MRQSARNPLHYALSFLRVLRQIGRQSIQNIDNAPLVAVVHGRQQFLGKILVEFEERLSFEFAADGEGNESIGDDCCVAVVEQVFKQFEEALVLHDLGCNFEHFGHAECSGFADIGIFILECALQGIQQILGYILDSDAAHRPDGECAQERVGFIDSILNEGARTLRKVLTPRIARSGCALA